MNKVGRYILSSVLSGILAVCAIFVMYYIVTGAMAKMSEELLSNNRARIEAAKLEADKKAQEAAYQQVQKVRIDQYRRQHLDQAQHDSLARSDIQKQASQFYRVYEAPEGCEAPQNERQLTECVNHKMRAKRVFLANYSSLPPGATSPPSQNALQYGSDQ
jgi:hypothetical protein